jgi:hypothetical protein
VMEMIAHKSAVRNTAARPAQAEIYCSDRSGGAPLAIILSTKRQGSKLAFKSCGGTSANIGL